jgi:hypothetical protein
VIENQVKKHQINALHDFQPMAFRRINGKNQSKFPKQAYGFD